MSKKITKTELRNVKGGTSIEDYNNYMKELKELFLRDKITEEEMTRRLEEYAQSGRAIHR